MDLCIVVTNVRSGNYSAAVRPAVADRLGDRYTFIDFDLDADYVTLLSQGVAKAIAVCGENNFKTLWAAYKSMITESYDKFIKNVTK